MCELEARDGSFFDETMKNYKMYFCFFSHFVVQLVLFLFSMMSNSNNGETVQ